MGFRLGTAPPETVYTRGSIKGYIYPYYNNYPIVTEGGQYRRLGFRVKGLGSRGLGFKGLGV